MIGLLVVEVGGGVVWEVQEEGVAVDGVVGHVVVEAACGLVGDMEFSTCGGFGFLLDACSGAEDEFDGDFAEGEDFADAVHEVAFVVEGEAVWVVDDQDQSRRVCFDL